MLIEEVRRWPGGTSATVPSDAAPFRPERHDESCRGRARTRPILTAPAAATVAPTTTGGTIATIHAANSGLPPSPGAEPAGSTHTTPIAVAQQQQQQSTSPPVSGGCWTEGGLEFEPLWALAGPLSLPPAGLRTTLVRRLANPVAKRRRLGNGSRGGSGGSGDGGDGDDGGAGKQVDRDIKFLGKRGMDNEHSSVEGDDNNGRTKNSGLAGTGFASGRSKEDAAAAAATATALPPLGASAFPGSGISHHLDKVPNSAPGGAGTRVPLAAISSNEGGTLLPRITGGSGARDADDSEEGAGDRKVGRRRTVAPGAEPWAGMNFADINDDDDNVRPGAPK